MHLCKLCENNPPGLQESHIIPKFFTKNIYFTNFKNQKMKTMKFANKIMGEVEKDWQQDGLKEVGLFCADCEKYFEILDTHFCNKIYKHFRNPKEIKKYFILLTLKHQMAVCEKANENIVALFLVSLFLRCHLSELPFCKNFQLNPEEFQKSKDLLNKYYSLKQNELQNNVSTLPLGNLFSYLIFTYSNNSKIESNLNFVECDYRSYVGIYHLVINDYIFTLYLKEAPFVFSETLNTNSEKVKITILNDKGFNEVRYSQF